MDWQIEIDKNAQKSLKKIPDPYKSNIIETIDSLNNQPRPYKCKKLKSKSNLWRLRVGPYRIVYQIKDKKMFILIIRIGHRSDVYRGLD